MGKQLDSLRIFRSHHPKRRVGPRYDGGYVICDLPGHYDGFISGGIGKDVSFEQRFLDLNPGLRCEAFDGTVDELPVADGRIEFHRKNLGAVETDIVTNLCTTLDRYSNVFMKIDIEGHEFRLLPALLRAHMCRVRQLVMEIHTPGDIQRYPRYFEGLSDITHEVMFSQLRELNSTHVLVHVHPNNGCATHRVDGILMPNVFEATYIRGDMLESRELSDAGIPGPLDMPNIPAWPEIALTGYPWQTAR